MDISAYSDHLILNRPWLADTLAELTALPAGRHDDQVDSTAQALGWAEATACGASG